MIKKIQEILENNQFICSSPLDETSSFSEKLEIILGPDHKGRELIMEIIAAQQLIPPQYTHANSPEHPQQVQFWVELPFDVKDVALNQMSNLLHFLNQMIELPGFELDELNGKVIYRYVWITHAKMIDDPLIMGITGAILLTLNLLEGTIESLAEGEVSFNDLLSQIVQLTKDASAGHKFPFG